MTYELSSSSDGKDFQQVLEFKVKGLNAIKQIEIPATKSLYYKLKIKNLGYSDSWLAITLAEVELLKTNEVPSYNPGIPIHQEKTVMVKADDKNSFEEIGLSNGPVDQSKVFDISNKMDANGMLDWNAPAGNWKITCFGYITTGAINEPATYLKYYLFLYSFNALSAVANAENTITRIDTQSFLATVIY